MIDLDTDLVRPDLHPAFQEAAEIDRIDDLTFEKVAVIGSPPAG